MKSERDKIKWMQILALFLHMNVILRISTLTEKYQQKTVNEINQTNSTNFITICTNNNLSVHYAAIYYFINSDAQLTTQHTTLHQQQHLEHKRK